MKPINIEKIILASKSPRRKELLEKIGINIQILPSNIDEDLISIKSPEDYVKELAFLKAESIALIHPDTWIIGADTIVVEQDQIFGKPKSKSQAFEMLNKLNNCEHSVYTGFCVMNNKKKVILKNVVETKVYFKNLSHEEINFYINTDEPFDKAGGYGIQGIGSFMVKRIAGSYTNVVGLPVCELVETLKELNIIHFKDLNHYAIN